MISKRASSVGDEEKIMTRHPAGKNGRNISRAKYEMLKSAMVSALERKELTHQELFAQLNKKLQTKFDGNINWYGETVKLDLEARGLIARTSSNPQRYFLTEK